MSGVGSIVVLVLATRSGVQGGEGAGVGLGRGDAVCGLDADAVLQLASTIAESLGRVEGVVAVALGGSWARGTAVPDSDIDLGLYYEAAAPPSLDALRALAAELDDRRDGAVLTAFGEWGPWINGGGWLRIDGRPVDWLYRDLGRVRAVLAACRAGQVETAYQVGHPHAFHSPIYLGEVRHCRPLADAGGVLATLRDELAVYPPALRATLIRRFLWEAEFSLFTGEKGVGRGDVAYVAGALYRTVACLAQVLHALNERYCLNEKGAVRACAGFPICPSAFEETATAVLAAPGATPATLAASVSQLRLLTGDVRALCLAGGVALFE